MKKKFKETKGITLIALVLTIIVLLILAGVTIATLTGDNGILSQAQGAKDSTERAGEKEKIQLEVLGSYETDGNLSLSKLKDNINSHIKEVECNDVQDFPLIVTYTATGHVYQVDSSGSVSKKRAQLVYGDVDVKLADGSDLPTGGATEGSKLKIEFTIEIENGTIEEVTPGTYNSTTKILTHETTDAEIAAKEVNFTISCTSEGQSVTPSTKTVDLSGYYKVEFSVSDIKKSVNSFYGKWVTNYMDTDRRTLYRRLENFLCR